MSLGDVTTSASAPDYQPLDDTRAALLSVENLHVHFVTPSLRITAVAGVSFHVNPGEILAVVGESGSGKSVTALSIMRLLTRRTAQIPKGRIYFSGRDLLSLSEDDMRAIRGREISMIFQGADDVAQSGSSHRAADYRAFANPSRPDGRGGAGSSARAIAHGGNHRC